MSELVEKERGLCRACGRSYVLRSDGAVIGHGSLPINGRPCPGAGLPPVDPPVDRSPEVVEAWLREGAEPSEPV